MKMQITTTAQGCHVTVNIKIEGQTLLSLSDNSQGSVVLLSGLAYRFEWFVFAAQDAKISIAVDIDPANDGLNPFVINNNYSAGDRDGNVFLFTLK